MSESGRVHIVGAGLAGLSAAVKLAQGGRRISIYEATRHAGGRCRSFHDPVLERLIDNGNHLVLSGNQAVMAYLAAINAEDKLSGPLRAEFPFVDLTDDTHWTVRPDKGAIPWSALSSSRRVPGTSIGEYLSVWRLSRATASQTIGQCLATEGALWHRFWHPVIVSILNTDPASASAELLWAVMKETFGKGEAACRPLIAVNGLSETFVYPALRYLRAHTCEVQFNQRVRAVASNGGRVTALDTGDRIDLDSDDAVVIAVPPTPARQLMPELVAPDSFRPIVNGHFRTQEAIPMKTFVGVVGGMVEWLFFRGDVVSATVSAATALSEMAESDIADAMWSDISRVLKLDAPCRGPYRIIKEKRATFEQTPAQVARRPKTETALDNLFLAGDWTDTSLPATIEGTIQSGFAAADIILNRKSNG